MPPYKIYVTDSKTGAKLPPVSVRCLDDEAAIEKAAETLAEGQIGEVWEGARFVTRLDPGEDEGQG